MQTQLVERWIYWGAAFVFGMLLWAHILVLPPHEGFDETAHYSYISYLADEYQIPILGRTPLDQNVNNERFGLPKPYHSEPPFEQNNGTTYKIFFDQLSDVEREHILRKYWFTSNRSVTFKPDNEKNWEAQHPPLYYTLMTLPYRISTEWSVGMRLLWLRFFSIMLVVVSLIFWFESIQIMPVNSFSRYILVLSGLIILFFPSLFFDLARLGNDGLAVCLFAGIFYFLLACYYQDGEKRFRNFLCLSIFLGLGLLTKLFFLPITIGTLGAYIWQEINRRHFSWKVLLLHLASCFGLILLISGWWYIWCFYQYDAVFISDELIRFKNIEDPLGQHLSWTAFLFQLIRNFGSFCGSFLWSGTWSWIRRPLESYLLFGPLALLIMISGYRFLRRHHKIELALWVACFFHLIMIFGGFGYHMYLRVKYTGLGSGTGGYYLFIAWPAIGCLAAICFGNTRSLIWKYCLVFAFGCVLIFEISGWWILLQVYAGVIEKVENVKTGIGAINLTPENLLFVLERLKDLVFPYSANVLYLCATIMKIFLVWVAIFRYPQPTIAD